MDISIITIGLLFFLLIYSETRGYLERKRLLDRIMAKSYTEYAAWNKAQVKKPIEKKSNLIPL